MNYAEDRLDRRARFLDCSQQEGLWADFTSSLSVVRETTSCNNKADACGNQQEPTKQAHERLGQCLRDVGWNRHAVYHFAVAWMLDSSSSQRAGDYAQMAELAGFPEIGALALFYWFHHHQQQRQEANAIHVPLKSAPLRVKHSHEMSLQLDPTWLRQSTPPVGHCGCGSTDCGSQHCFLPMNVDQLDLVMHALEQSLLANHIHEEGNSIIPSANTILGIMAKNALDHGTRPLVPLHSNIPEPLAFWKSGTSHPLLQLLLLKLLYQTLPTLAATAVVELQSHMDPLQATLAASHKSHWAYYVLIRSVVLGERIKPHRRWTLPAYHIPVWDVLWDKDVPTPPSSTSGTATTTLPTQDVSIASGQHDPQSWLKQLRQTLDVVSTRIDGSQPANGFPLNWTLAPPKGIPHVQPLFVIGDSHVLSLAWQTLSLPRLDISSPTCQRRQRRLVPIIVTGLKAFHIRPDSHFFTNSNLHTCLHRLQSFYQNMDSCCTVLFSAGEIDCREGIGGPELLEGYRLENNMGRLESLVQHNVQEYVAALEILLQTYSFLKQILVMPVAPHAARNSGKKVGRAVRRQITHMWNDALRNILSSDNGTITTKGVYLLYYEPSLRQVDASSPVGYVLNPLYNADNTHLNAAVLPVLQKAIQECGCNLNLL